MILELNVSLILALVSLAGTIITIITFLNKLKWDNIHHLEQIKNNEKKITDIAKKAMEIELAMARISTSFDHITKTVEELKKYVRPTV